MEIEETLAAAERTSAGGSVGEILRLERIAQGLMIEQISRELHIEVRQLRLLEEDRFAQIGPQVFVKGYIRQYGQRLGLEVGDLLARYQRQGEVPEVALQPSRTIELGDERQTTTWILLGAAVVLIAIAAGIWWFNDRSIGGSAVTAPAVSAPSPTPAPSPLPASVEIPLPALGETPAVAPLDEGERADGDLLAVDPGGDAVPVTVVFAGDSWLEITDAAGESLYYGLGEPGGEITVSGVPPFAFVAGNPAAMRVTVAGQEIALPNDAGPGNMARFTVGVPEPPED